LVEKQIGKKVEETLTDRLRELFKEPLEQIGQFLSNRKIKANWITLFGAFGSLIGSLLVARGALVSGGIIILSMGILDALDGAVARASKTTKKFGAFLDSVTDRYIEIFIYGGLLWYFIQEGNQVGIFFSYIAIAGSVLVSYTRARAESLGIETKVGILTRVERMVVIGPSILFKVPLIGVIVVGILANISALQRIFHVHQQMEELE
jgi:CDP-diacylglycerol--glycerol-3-phosphate 3-phosphatidyltransferase